MKSMRQQGMMHAMRHIEMEMCIRDRVYSYTGYGLDKLEEKNGTYYTESGENILDLVDKAVEDSGRCV